MTGVGSGANRLAPPGQAGGQGDQGMDEITWVYEVMGWEMKQLEERKRQTAERAAQTNREDQTSAAERKRERQAAVSR